MANTHNLFEEFNSNISLTAAKKDKMTKSKDSLRTKIRNYFAENHPKYVPKFYIQGSYKMKTAIRTKDDICDLDDGVYFFIEPEVTGTILQSWIKNAVDGHTSEAPEHRKKCIRSIFKGDYEIDMPVYYKTEKKDYQLAVKNNDWTSSDPKEMVDWFNLQKDKTGVLLKIVKYLKAWCDFKRNQMPSGLAMTILASNAKNQISYNENRDDISLRDTLKEIKKALNIKFECIVPAVPHDNLFEDYDNERKRKFLDALDKFVEDADKAILEKNYLKASKLWQKHLGDSSRFPDGEDKEDSSENELKGLLSIAEKSKPWGTNYV